MIEAAQGADTIGVLAAAAALLGVEELGDALQAAQSLARALAERGLFVRAPLQDEPCEFEVRPARPMP